MKRAYLVAIAGAILACGGLAAHAQQNVLQGGNWTVGNVPKYAGTNSGQPVVVDSGLSPGSPLVTVVASLPTCASGIVGKLYVVTDATAPTYGATLTGGGAVVALALCDGSLWKAH